MSRAYYNECDSFAAQWLRELINVGLIAPGDVDERPIQEVTPDDLVGYTQCHFFAGIGVWSYALRCAGWSDDRPVWTGSCPCQPFSASGKRGGGSKTNVTSGRTGSHSFASANLQSSLENRLRVLMDSSGSMLFRMTWKERVTPSGRRILARRASALRTSDSDSTSWPTPAAHEFEPRDVQRMLDRRRHLAEKQGNNGFGLSLGMTAHLAGWATTTTRDWKDGKPGSNVPINSLLGRQVWLASWPSPTVNESTHQYTGRDKKGNRIIAPKLTGVARGVKVIGHKPNGSPVVTASTGQLNPALPRWLQGLPPEWDACAVMAMLSAPRSPRRSSERT